MTRNLKMHCRLLGIGTLLIMFGLFSQPAYAQCDFINDITGITQTTPPIGDAANPALYTQTFVLVDDQGNIFATSSTPDFTSVPAGLFNMYAINYDNTEAAAVLPLLSPGLPWISVEVYGDDTVNNCLAYTTPYGTGCPIVVCEEVFVCEFESFTNPALNFATTDYTQAYCIVCSGIIVAIEAVATFDLATLAAVTSGADCQLFAINYRTIDGFPYNISDPWSTLASDVCAGNCIDYVGVDMVITGLSQASGAGISTYEDWTDVTDGCSGAQVPTNGGATFSETVNNLCVPPFEAGPIQPLISGNPNDLYALRTLAVVPCTGTMDLTQHTIFYTVEASNVAPSQMEVNVSNPGGDISMMEAALFGPVNPTCPILAGGSFVDCDDSGTGSQSAEPLSDLILTTAANPGDIFIVIVDTEGTGNFTIESEVFLSSKLIRFDGHKLDKVNVLEWQVEDETNVSFYELEGSKEGVHNYETKAKISAVNSGSLALNYSYIDKIPGLGVTYYRLKTVSTDGDSKYSNTIALTREDESLGGITLYPNPAEGTFYMEFTSGEQTEIDYKIHDVLGRLVSDGTHYIRPGFNKLKFSLDGFPSASYIVSFLLHGEQIKQRVIKQ